MDNKIIELYEKENNRLETENHKLVQENKQLKEMVEIANKSRDMYEEVVKELTELQERYKKEIAELKKAIVFLLISPEWGMCDICETKKGLPDSSHTSVWAKKEPTTIGRLLFGANILFSVFS